MTSTLLLSVLLFYAILIAVNLPAPFLGLKFETESTARLWYEPPGFIIPIIWFILFTLLGIARNILLQNGQAHLQWWLLALALLCASYAYYTLGLAKITAVSALWYGLAGNITVILFAGLVCLKLLPFSKSAAWLTAPVVLWTVFATLIVIGQLKQEKLISL